jgi:hypothetical protein
MRNAHLSSARFALILTLFVAGCHARIPDPAQPLPSTIPRNAWRFAVVELTDSTVRFDASDARWLRPGMIGYAVDPSKKDALVASLSLMGTGGREYKALITGQREPVDSTHIVVFLRPDTPWWRTKHYWGGFVIGVVVTTVAALAAK